VASSGQWSSPTPTGNEIIQLKKNTYTEIVWIFSPCHIYVLTTLNVHIFSVSNLIRLLHSKQRQVELLFTELLFISDEIT